LSLGEPPAAAEPESCDWLCEALLPPAAEEPVEPEAPCTLELEPLGGHEQFDAPALEPVVPPLAAVPPVALLVDEPVEPPALDEVLGVEADAPPAAVLDEPLELEGELLLLELEGELPPAAPLDPEALPEPDDWLVCAPWFMVEDGLVVVALWLADVLLETFWSPEPMFTPGLMLAPALTSVLLMPTLASTPTFGLTFTPPEGNVLELELEGLEEPPAAEGELLPEAEGALPPVVLEPEVLPEPVDWLCCVLWLMVDDGLVVVALWLAETPLETFWSPVPALMPGLTFAPAFTSLFEMPTLAPTPTLGFTLVPPEGAVVEPPELWVVCDCWSVELDDWPQAVPKAAITAAAVILTAKCRALMSPPSGVNEMHPRCRKGCAEQRAV
jgi:hypothetical protein